jgi:hypothetical protein
MSERFEYFENFNKKPLQESNQENQMRRNLGSIERPNDAFEKKLGEKQLPSDRSVWVDAGIKDVPLNKINLDNSPVQSAEDFRKVPYPEMKAGVLKLEKEIRPAVKAGATNDDFHDMDQRNGLDYPNGSQRIYESFYGDTAIRLDNCGGRYEVVNGYHRLFIANELKLETIPARVYEKKV